MKKHMTWLILLSHVSAFAQSPCSSSSGTEAGSAISHLVINTRAIEDHLRSPLPTLADTFKPIVVNPKAKSSIEKDWEAYRAYRDRHGEAAALKVADQKFPSIAAGLRMKRDLFGANGDFRRPPLLNDRISAEARINGLPDKYQEMGHKMKYLAMTAAGVIGALLAMPPSVTKWDENMKLEDVTAKWKKNVTRPPVVDQDDWWINYIGHPYSGAAYYVMARDTGFSPSESAIFSVLMSTFLWEYGLEAFAERPSIQDLILTPGIGSLIGEAMYQVHQKLEKREWSLGSDFADSAAKFVLNPAGTLIDSMVDGEDKYKYRAHYYVQPGRGDNRGGDRGVEFGVRIRERF